MDNNQINLSISQEFEIIPHQKGRAYPIGVKEWEYIKNKIKDIKIEVNIFYSIGFLLFGASASSLITIITTDFKDDASKYWVWTLFAVSLLGGLLSTFFAKDKNKQENTKPKEIINQMELIEARFETLKE